MENMEAKAQEMYMEFQELDNRIKQLQKHLEVLTNQIMEMTGTLNTLDEFSTMKKDKEIFVPLSSGIFAKAILKDASELLVNVGSNVVVTKNAPSAKKLISGQIDEMKKLHKRLVEDLEKMAGRAGNLEMELQKMVSQAQNS